MTEPNKNPADWPGHTIADALVELQARWGWFVALGIVLLCLGGVALAHVFAATLASVIFIGAMMALAGAGQLVHAWRIKQVHGFVFWSVSGLFYLGAGLFAMFYPVRSEEHTSELQSRENLVC